MTTVHWNHEKGTLSSRKININNWIFQGDSISPLLFCIGLAPLSTLINKSGYGLIINSMVISHLYYMDDLQTIAKMMKSSKNTHYRKSLQWRYKGGVRAWQMCKSYNQKGKVTSTENINLGLDAVIHDVEQDSTYRYRGITKGMELSMQTWKRK